MEQTKSKFEERRDDNLNHIKERLAAQTRGELNALDSAYYAGYHAGQAALREEAHGILSTKKTPRRRRPKKSAA